MAAEHVSSSAVVAMLSQAFNQNLGSLYPTRELTYAEFWTLFDEVTKTYSRDQGERSYVKRFDKLLVHLYDDRKGLAVRRLAEVSQSLHTWAAIFSSGE